MQQWGHTMRKIAAAAMATILLGGCQSIFGHQAKLEVRPIGAETSESGAAVALEEGRQFLKQGQVASAIVSLQIAAVDPTTAAAAHNGLGVAYATLGRGDMAERYFRQAIAEDPVEAKYSANLARFYQSREAALAKIEAKPIVEVATTTDPTATVTEVAAQRSIQAGPSLVRVSSPLRREAFTRISLQEVEIHTSAQDAALAPADQRRRNPRFAATKPTQAAQHYPLRIDLTKFAKR